MILKVLVTNYLSETLELELTSPEKSGVYVKSITGIGSGKANISTTELASDDGGIYNSARAETRNIVINLGMYDTLIDHPEWSIEDSRHLIYKYFPKKKFVTLTFITDRHSVFITGYVESNEDDIFSKEENANISIICPDPNFYSLDQEVNWMGGIISRFEFPFENNTVDKDLDFVGGEPKLNHLVVPALPVIGVEGTTYYVRTIDPYIVQEYVYSGGNFYQTGSNKILHSAELEFSELNDFAQYVINYDGDIEVGMTLTIHFLDVASNITIYHVDPLTNVVIGSMVINTDRVNAVLASLEEPEDPIKAGDDIVISTINGFKSMVLNRDDHSWNVLNGIIRDDPEWFKLEKGKNIFRFAAESGRDNLQIKVENAIAFEGV